MCPEVLNQEAKNDPELLQIQHLLKRVGERYHLSPQTLLSTLERDFFLPVSIFTKNLSPLETVCKYFKENCHYTNKQIAAILSRSEKTTSQAYRASLKKSPQPLSWLSSGHSIPISLFHDRKNSMAGLIVKYMKETLGLRFIDIAKELQRDQRTIWTTYQRTLSKKKQ